MRGAVASTGNAVKAGKELLYIVRLAIGAADPLFGRCPENQLFKLRFALKTSIFKNRHGCFYPSLMTL